MTIDLTKLETKRNSAKESRACGGGGDTKPWTKGVRMACASDRCDALDSLRRKPSA